MSTDQCRRLLDAYRYARRRRTKVIVLMGGLVFFSNGIHLNVTETAVRVTSAPFTAIGTREAVDIGLLDGAFGATADVFRAGVRSFAEQLARDPRTAGRLAHKRRRRALDERQTPLAAYRAEELRRSHACFFGPDRSYHEARRRFVYKLGSPCAV